MYILYIYISIFEYNICIYKYISHLSEKVFILKTCLPFFWNPKRRQVKTLYLIRHGEAVSWSPTIGIHSAWVLHCSLFVVLVDFFLFESLGKSNKNNKIIRWCRHYCWNTPLSITMHPLLWRKMDFQHTLGWLLLFQPSVGCFNHQSSKPGINRVGTRWLGGCFGWRW